MITLAACITAGFITVVFSVSKMLFLYSYQAGYLMVLANTLYDVLYKKCRVKRSLADAVLYPVIVIVWSMLWSHHAGIFVAIVLALVWVQALTTDIQWRSGRFSHQHTNPGLKVPYPVPNLITIVQGPVLERSKNLDCGDWPLHFHAEFAVIVLNPSEIRPQCPVSFEVSSSAGGIHVLSKTHVQADCPEPGKYYSFPLVVETKGFSASPVEIHVKVTHADLVDTKILCIKSVGLVDNDSICAADVTRWKGGSSAAFGWRGDQDVYDPATFQSKEGLASALALSSRFHIPGTLFLSARLSLVTTEHESFCDHFKWNRHPEEIESFIEYLKNEVSISQELEFPMENVHLPALELGNHSYLHHGTHTAADPANNWKSGAWVGEGKYNWLSVESPDSFTEQRDNVRKGYQIIKDVLNVETSSWASPGRVFDRNTARAVEAAGIEIGSDTNASTATGILECVRPHHPKGCSALVELTKKYPGDPDNAYKSAVLKYWLGAMKRRKSALIFMAHHHLLQYQGTACYRITEQFFDHVLRYGNGDFYIATLTAIGRYWRDILSPVTRCIEVKTSNNQVIVKNNGNRKFSMIPVEISFESGRRHLRTIDINSGEEVVISFSPQESLRKH